MLIQNKYSKFDMSKWRCRGHWTVTPVHISRLRKKIYDNIYKKVINIHHNYLNVKLLLLYFLSLIKHLVYKNTALFLGGFMRRDHTWKCPL